MIYDMLILNLKFGKHSEHTVISLYKSGYQLLPMRLSVLKKLEIINKFFFVRTKNNGGNENRDNINA